MTTHSYTAAIIGGGPAGSQCALWLKMMGLNPIIIEAADHLGGLQSFSPYQNQWVAGLMNVSGREFAQRIHAHILSKEIDVMFNAEVSTCVQAAHGFVLKADDQELLVKFIVLATGAIHHDGSTTFSEDTFATQQISADNGWHANLPSAFHQFQNKILNQDGFIITNANCETPVTGLFAIGEAANRMHPCVVTSMADGVVAAKAIQSLVS